MNQYNQDLEEPDLFAFQQELSQTEKFKAFLNSRRQPAYSFTLEALTAILAIFIVLLIIAFYLGFLRGKAVARVDSSPGQHSVEIHQNTTLSTSELPFPPQEGGRAQSALNVTPVASQASPSSPSKENDLPIAKTPKKPYTIQVVAYRSKDRALQEISRLKRKGYSSQIIKEGAFFVVCVGNYNNRSEAGKEIKALKRIYHDSYLRKI